MPQLQKSIDLAHDIREYLPFLSVYLEQSETLEDYSSVWISQTSEKHWFQNKDVISVSGYDAKYLCKQYRIFLGHLLPFFEAFYSREVTNA